MRQLLTKWQERDLEKKLQFEQEVGPSFNYQSFLRHHAKRVVEELTKIYPSASCEVLLAHPLANNDEDVDEDAIHSKVGSVYFRLPYFLPEEFVSELGGNLKEAARLCPAIERIELHPALQRRGFLHMLSEELRAAKFRYLIISSVANESFARHLYALSLQSGSGCQFLYPSNFEVDGEIELSTFSWDLQIR